MIETFYNQDVNSAVKVRYIDGNVFSLDNNGNKIGIYLYSDGSPVNVSGSVSASVIRADGATVAVTGSASGNLAFVILPQAALAVPGLLSIVIKVTSGEDVMTVGAIVANVYQSSTDSAVDPGTIIPSVQTLIDEIENAIASIPADYSDLLAAVASEYSNTKTYPVVGSYVWYNGVLKRSIVPITTTESFTSAHWANAVLGDDLCALNSTLDKQTTEIMQVVGNDKIVFSDNCYVQLNVTSVNITTPVSDNNWRCAIIPCQKGDMFILNALGGVAQRTYGVTDSTGSRLSAAAQNTSLTNYTLTITEENAAYLIINDKKTGGLCFYGESIKSKVDRLTDDVDAYERKLVTATKSLSSTATTVKYTSSIVVPLIAENTYKIKISLSGTITTAQYIALYADGTSSADRLWRTLYDSGTSEYICEYNADRNSDRLYVGISEFVGNVSISVSVFQILHINEELDNLEEEVTAIKNADSSYTDSMISIFESFAVIGDSLACGFVSNGSGSSYGSNTARAAHRNWVSYLALDIGRTFTNLARGSSTVQDWRYGNTSLDVDISTANIDTYCYMIGLGVNDVRGHLTVGAASDIAASMDNNSNTFYGNYDWVVRKLIQYKTARIDSAKILVFTIPNTETNAADYNTAIRYVASLYEDVHVIDLANLYPTQFITPPLSDVWIGNHSRPIGYAYIAMLIKRAINQYMFENPLNFAYTPWDAL